MDRDDRLTAYLQKRLSDTDAAAFEAEMAEDPTLQAEVAVMRAAGQVTGTPVATDEMRQAGWDRLSSAMTEDIAPHPANTNRPISLLKAASIALVAVFAWEFAVTPMLPTSPDSFVPASAVADGPALRVAFAAEAQMADVTALVQELGGTVEAGPSAIGLYTIVFASPTARDNAETALTGRSDLVMMVSRP